jgi:alanine racemase
MHHPLRLRCDTAALIANYRHLRVRSGTPAGAAVKANAYGLGASAVARHLLQEGCRNFFVSTWWEAAELDFLPPQSIAVLHGFGADDAPIDGVRPVLVSPEQVTRWKESGRAGQKCDLMVDTGMSRLGLRADQLDVAAGLTLHTVHSHLACADEDHPLNRQQLELFQTIREHLPAERYSLANSAGIYLGSEYAFDLVRPGLALYGGIPREEARGQIRPVVHPQAQVLQIRTVQPGESIGYNATFVADRTMSVAVLNIGYADGYWRSLATSGYAHFSGAVLPIVGRISMDLITLDATTAPSLREGDWLDFSFDLERQAAASGMSQYELLTGLSRRWQRVWS